MNIKKMLVDFVVVFAVSLIVLVPYDVTLEPRLSWRDYDRLGNISSHSHLGNRTESAVKASDALSGKHHCLTSPFIVLGINNYPTRRLF